MHKRLRARRVRPTRPPRRIPRAATENFLAADPHGPFELPTPAPHTALHAPREAHPVIDDLAQAVLFETQDKQDRMTAFLERKERR